MNPQTIVCPIELAPADVAALAQALAVARWYDSDLHVVHVHPSRRPEPAMVEQARDAVARLVEAETSRPTRPDTARAGAAPVTFVVLTGHPVKAIADYTRRTAADLLVVGQDGHRERGYWSAGAFAAALGRAVRCPTIIVPHADVGGARAHAAGNGDRHGNGDDNGNGDGARFANILCAVDFSAASRRALDEALVLAQQRAGRVMLLHAMENFPYETIYSGTAALRLIREYQARVEQATCELHRLVPPDALDWCTVQAETVSGEPDDAILRLAAERGADLIVLGLPRRPRFEQWLSGSTVKKVLRRAAAPVLVVPGAPATSAGVLTPWAEGLDALARSPAVAPRPC